MAERNTENIKMVISENYTALLMDYAAGSLDEAQSMIVATHLTLSPDSRKFVEVCESVGGGLMDDCAPAEMSANSLDDVLGKLNNTIHVQTTHTPCKMLDDMQIPRPLQSYIKDKEDLPWKKIFSGLYSYDLKVPSQYSKARMLKIDPGTKTPQHSHGGIEITLMLDGAAYDETGSYKRGDMIVMDERVTHQPVADEKLGCVCLVVNTDPMKFTSWPGRLINPFLKK